MNRLTLIIWTVAFVMICHLQGTAQNLVTPPSGLPQERWELTYNDYRAPIYEQSLGYFQSITADYPRIPPHDDLINLKKEVVIVRDGNDIYIKGIFAVYPNAWIKCKVSGDRLNIGDNQIIDLNGSVYFHFGTIDYDGSLNIADGTIGDEITFTPDEKRVSLIFSDDGSTITAKSNSEWNGYTPGFWFDNSVSLQFMLHYYRSEYRWYSGKSGYYYIGTGCPDVEYMVNMVFRKM